MENNNRKRTKIKLERHMGCKNCNRPCIHNANVCIPDVAKRSKDKIFRCNSSHLEFGKNSEI